MAFKMKNPMLAKAASKLSTPMQANYSPTKEEEEYEGTVQRSSEGGEEIQKVPRLGLQEVRMPQSKTSGLEAGTPEDEDYTIREMIHNQLIDLGLKSVLSTFNVPKGDIFITGQRKK